MQPQQYQAHQGWYPQVVAAAPQRGNNRGKSFARGRGGRQKKQQERQKPVESEKPQPAPEIPKPKYLSKTPSKETNDPLYKEAWFPEPGNDLSPAAEELYVYPACEVLPVVTEVTYKEAVASKQGFSKRVAESAFAYYCAVLTYKRLLQVYRDNQFEIEPFEETFIKQVDAGEYLVPSVLATYLNGFGNTSIPSGRDLKLNLRRPEYENVDDLPGWFGQVGANTHYLYKSYPCLAVYAYRIQHDLGLPEEALDDEEDDVAAEPDGRWDLPEELRPVGRAGRPTENLLGWRRSERLSREKRDFLHLCNITAQEFPSNNRGLCFNMRLMNAVNTELRNVERLNFQTVSTLSAGSQGQLTFDKFYATAREGVEVRQQCITNSMSGPLGPASFIGGSLVYRTIHKIDGGPKNWSIYQWGQYRNVPQAWIDNVNILRDDEPPEINMSRYRTTPFYVIHRIKQFTDKEVNLKPP